MRADQLLFVFLLLVSRFFFRTHLAGGCRGCGAGFGINLVSATGGRQIPDMTDTGFNNKLWSKILIDCLSLGRRLDDDQRF